MTPLGRARALAWASARAVPGRSSSVCVSSVPARSEDGSSSLPSDDAEHEQGRHEDHHEPHEDGSLARRAARRAALGRTSIGRRTAGARKGLDLVAGLVVGAVLLHENVRVEAHQLRIGAQEGLDEGGPGERSPFLVLERPQILRANLRPCLDIRDVELLTHPRFPEGFAYRRHAAVHSGGRRSKRRAEDKGDRRAALAYSVSSGAAATAALVTGSSRAASTRERSASVTSTLRAFDPSYPEITPRRSSMSIRRPARV